MANWTYRCYDDGNSPNLWRRWYDKTAPARGAHDATFDMLEQMEVWGQPNFKSLGQGLWEVRFQGQDRRQWRVFGSIDQGIQEFCALNIGYHKDRRYTPPTVLDKSRDRLNEIRSTPEKAVRCVRPGS
jgi:Phage derived protein Gp49-like (DUF891)